MVAGTQRAASLDDSLGSLSRLAPDLSVSVVTLDVFALPSGERVVIREVEETEHRKQVSPTPSARTIEAVAARADKSGSSEGFAALCSLAGRLGLRVKPRPLSVTITGAVQGNPTVLYVRPEDDGVVVWISEPQAERFLGLTSDDLEALGVPVITAQNALQRWPAHAYRTPRSGMGRGGAPRDPREPRLTASGASPEAMSHPSTSMSKMTLAWDDPGSWSPREFIAEARGRYAKTMPQWPHEYTIKGWRPERAVAFELLCRAIRAEGTRQPWPQGSPNPRYHNYYLVVDAYRHWALGPNGDQDPPEGMSVINREAYPDQRSLSSGRLC